ncbi:MAG: outer membrane beta-barrel protein [Methylococcales bacterium]
MKKFIATFGLILGLALFGVQITHASPPAHYMGFSIGSADDDVLSESDTGFKYYAGLTLNKNLGFELSYVDLGQYLDGTLEQYGIAFQVVGYLPVSTNFNLIGKAGIFSWTVDDDTFYAYNDGNDLTYGLGVQYDFDNRISIRGEWEQFSDVAGGDVSLVSAGLLYAF